MRVQKFLSMAGVWPRRHAEIEIASGNVRINGEIVTVLSKQIDADRDTVEWQDDQGTWHKAIMPKTTVVYAINKPIQYTSTVKDPYAIKTVMDLVPQDPHVVPIGRLDQDSEGLMLLSNNGELVNQLTHPAHHVPKTYRVRCSLPDHYDKKMIQPNLKKIESGVILDGERTHTSKISRRSLTIESSFITFEITLLEGRNRQIRRMMQKIGLHVVQLTRIAIGKLTLDELQLKVGDHCTLTDQQIGKLIHA